MYIYICLYIFVCICIYLYIYIYCYVFVYINKYSYIHIYNQARGRMKTVHAHETIIIKAPINVNTMIRKDFSHTFYIKDQTCTFIYENDGLHPKYIFIKFQQNYIYFLIFIKMYFGYKPPFSYTNGHV